MSGDRLSAAVAADRVARELFLAELVRTPSDNPPGDCMPFGAKATRLLEGLGFEVERHSVLGDAVRDRGMVSVVNLLVRHRFGSGPTLALNAHGDVVPPGSGWTMEPYGAAVRDGWMYGRGVAVSKSDIATYAFALKALIDCGASLAGTVELHVTMDEEAGGEIGPRWLIEQGLTKPDYAICAGFSYSVVVAHNGCIHLEVIVDGRSAHAADPKSGIDALAGTVEILNALYALRQDYSKRVSGTAGIGSPNLVVGLIDGGINTNVVPDHVRFTVDRRIIPEEDAAKVEQELRDTIKRATGPSLRTSVRRLLLANPLSAVPGHEKLVSALQGAARHRRPMPERSVRGHAEGTK